MTRPLSPALLRPLSPEPPFSTSASLPRRPVRTQHSDRRSGPAADARARPVQPAAACKRGRLAGALGFEDEPGLLPLIDTVVVEAAVAAAPPLLLDRLLSTSEAAALFGREPRTLHRWRQRGLIGAVRVGQAVFYVAADIDALIRGRLTADVLRASATAGSRVTKHG